MVEARSRQVVIAGAGVAGLTAALAFAGRGYAVTVLEQAKQLEAAGAGIQLSPNATRILRQLGVLDHLSAIRPEAVVLKDAATLRELARVPLGQALAAIGASDCVSAFLHPGFHMIAYPVSEGSAFNLAAFTKGKRIAEGWSGHADPAILAGAMPGTSPGLARLVAVAGPWTAFPIHTVEQRCWTMPEGVALIGDAAH